MNCCSATRVLPSRFLLIPKRNGLSVHGRFGPAGAVMWFALELNGVRFGSCIVPRSRKFWMLVDEETQAKAGVSAGDTVCVSVEPFERPDK